MQGKLEEEWLEQLAADDRKAYEMIFKAYYQSVYASALRMTKNGNSAKEVCREVFGELWENKKQLKISTSLKAYLHEGVMNKSLNILKSRNKEAEKNLENMSEMTSKDIVSLEVTEYRQLNTQIEARINRLPERCRQIFVLSRYEGKKYKEVAELLEISVETVESQILKALKTLRIVVKTYKNEIG